MFTKALLSIDLYTKNIHFTASQKLKTSTLIGGVISLFIYLVSFAIALIYFIELIESTTPFISFIESSYHNPPKLLISKDTFAFGFGVLDSDLFQYKITYNDGAYSTQIPTKKCQQSDFQNDYFKEANSPLINGMTCPAGNYSSVIHGNDFADTKSVLSIEIIQTDSKAKVDSKKTLRLLVGSINYNIHNHSNLFTYGINFKEITLETSYKTNINCLLSYQTLNRNTNILNSPHQTNTSIRIDEILTEKSSLATDPGIPSIIATITFISSNKYFIYEKRSLQLLEAMSIIGGNIYLLTVIGKAIAFVFEKTNNNLQILNSVFDFSSLNDSNNQMIMPNVKISDTLLQKSNLKEDNSNECCAKDKGVLRTSDIFPSLNFVTDNKSGNCANKTDNDGNNKIKKLKDFCGKTMVSIDDNLDLKVKKMIALKRARELSQKKLLSLSSFEIIQLYCCCHFNRLFNYKKKAYLEKRVHIDNLLELAYYFDKCLSIEKLQTVVLKKGHYGILSLFSRDMIEKNNYDKPLSSLINDQVAFDNNITHYLNKLRQPNYSFTQIDKKLLRMINAVSL